MPYNTTAIPPRKEPTGQTQLPLARVRKIIGADPDVALCSSNAAFVITLATEIFVQYLTSEAQNMVKLDRKPRRNLQYRDVANAARRVDRLEFLEDTVPVTVPFGKVKNDAAAAQARLHGASGSDGAMATAAPAIFGGSSAGGGGHGHGHGHGTGNGATGSGRSSSKANRSSTGGGGGGGGGSASSRPTTISALTDGVVDSTSSGKKKQQVLPFSILNRDDDDDGDTLPQQKQQHHGDTTNDEDDNGVGVAAAAALAQAAAASGTVDHGQRRPQARPHLHPYDDANESHDAAPYTYDQMVLDPNSGSGHTGGSGGVGYGPDAQLHLEEQGMPVGTGRPLRESGGAEMNGRNDDVSMMDG